MNNSVQSLLLNYLAALFHSGEFILVFYQMGEHEYIRKSGTYKKIPIVSVRYKTAHYGIYYKDNEHDKVT